MAEKQRTLKKSVTISGVGLHTGKPCNLTLNPAPENYGYKFQRIDLDEKPIIEADVDLVVDTSRGTTLAKNGAKVHTIEHVMAALVGMQIDNALITVDAPEIPIMDGSSLPFVEAIETAGFEDQKADREYLVITENITFEDTSRKSEILAVPADDYRLTVMVDYNSDVLGTQHSTMYHIGEFKQEIAKCRTFVFLHELEFLSKNNLIKGGDLDNAIVLVDKELPQDKLDELATLLNKPKMKVQGKGVLNNTTLHYYNEPARHKLLDIVGDFALCGKLIKGHILAARPGHPSNIAFAKRLKELVAEQKKKKNEVPLFDLNKEPIMNIDAISKTLPHRYPFLLIDAILELTPEKVVGYKNVTMNEEFFQGHFPGAPVMPGVLLIEAMAQTGGILVLKTVPDPENYLTYFLKIDKVKFKQKVLPGDTVIFVLDLMEPIRRGLCHMKGTAYVRNKPVMEAEMMAQIVKVKN
ncbi:MAG: bifunctional UDP-3-O-[3-hydroxymyristoyl] N-acetylglucosamine deacetylase/3-hydroxyacyl-ACP dehydratase [Bacteroidota bacterium]